MPVSLKSSFGADPAPVFGEGAKHPWHQHRKAVDLDQSLEAHQPVLSLTDGESYPEPEKSKVSHTTGEFELDGKVHTLSATLSETGWVLMDGTDPLSHADLARMVREAERDVLEIIDHLLGDDSAVVGTLPGRIRTSYRAVSDAMRRLATSMYALLALYTFIASLQQEQPILNLKDVLILDVKFLGLQIYGPDGPVASAASLAVLVYALARFWSMPYAIGTMFFKGIIPVTILAEAGTNHVLKRDTKTVIDAIVKSCAAIKTAGGVAARSVRSTQFAHIIEETAIKISASVVHSIGNAETVCAGVAPELVAAVSEIISILTTFNATEYGNSTSTDYPLLKQYIMAVDYTADSASRTMAAARDMVHRGGMLTAASTLSHGYNASDTEGVFPHDVSIPLRETMSAASALTHNYNASDAGGVFPHDVSIPLRETIAAAGALSHRYSTTDIRGVFVQDILNCNLSEVHLGTIETQVIAALCIGAVCYSIYAERVARKESLIRNTHAKIIEEIKGSGTFTGVKDEIERKQKFLEEQESLMDEFEKELAEIDAKIEDSGEGSAITREQAIHAEMRRSEKEERARRIRAEKDNTNALIHKTIMEIKALELEEFK